MTNVSRTVCTVMFLILVVISGFLVNPALGEEITITDGIGREVTVPMNPDSVICSGAGCLRYLTYLEAQDKIIGVDDIESEITDKDSRPYALANPQFSDLPIFGEFRGKDDPEKIVSLSPQVIFKTTTDVEDANELQEKTGIPVVALNYGDVVTKFDDMKNSLEIMGKIMNKESRANEVITFFTDRVSDLDSRTKDIPEADKTTAYVAGVGCAGSHGLQGTSFTYTPFQMVHVKNVAVEGTENSNYSCGDVSKESLIGWDPDVIFIDLGTLQLVSQGADAISELKNPEFAGLKAVQNDDVYGLISFNYYTTNQGSVLADAYYIGKLLYPDQFSDIDPASEADEIYSFLFGEDLFTKLNANAFDGLAFTQIPLN